MRKWWPIAELVLIECVRRKDAYVALILGLAVVAPLTQIHAFGVTGAVRYLREVSLLLIWISSAVVTVAAATRQIPDELARGTVYPILSRPISRADFVVGKFVGVLVASTALLAVFYLLFVLVSGTTAGEWLPSGIAQGFVLHVCFLAVVAAAALLLSIVLTPCFSSTTA
jgi:ABC-type transport system involved in multi-copper enzyme maturation permease subunit